MGPDPGHKACLRLNEVPPIISVVLSNESFTLCLYSYKMKVIIGAGVRFQTDHKYLAQHLSYNKSTQ